MRLEDFPRYEQRSSHGGTARLIDVYRQLRLVDLRSYFLARLRWISLHLWLIGFVSAGNRLTQTYLVR